MGIVRTAEGGESGVVKWTVRYAEMADELNFQRKERQ